ncbi:site-specific integrase [Glaciihabitans arcticus]|uniref:Site-specific integrase n=1 Tax=Glaciihabitans arcticus TaxID=2668039 RepID=A0A4Q9GRQ5_9MICO|nr:tyrosine-type recombinase/integrase [Glaciihabitans arcticus]TBN57245.1 site-specific integrase [Glaciihabitans arcticus]
MNKNWYERALKVDGLKFLREEEAFFVATLDAWGTQRRSAGRKLATIHQDRSAVENFAKFADRFPWQWTTADMSEYTTARIVGDVDTKAVVHSTIVGMHGAIRRYCNYLLSYGNDWASVCEERFGALPNQVCFDWNTRSHTSESEANPSVRGFSYDELATFWQASGEWVEEIDRSREKGWLAAMRDIALFKTAWAFGLRRNELRMLDISDLNYNPRIPKWGQYGKINVSYGKSSNGGQPKQRNVFLVPTHQDVIPELDRWVEKLRPQTEPGDLPALFVTERHSRVSLRLIDARFALLREFAGLPKVLTMHSLRRSYLTHIQESGLPALFAQYQAGHSHAATTARYTSPSNDYRSRVVATALSDYDRWDGQDGDHRVGVERPQGHGGPRHV